MQTQYPEMVETERLILRRFQTGDLPRYTQIRANPRVARFLSGGVESAKSPEKKAKAVFEQHARLWDQNGYGPWVVLDKRSGLVIGHGGLRATSETGISELLYALDEQWWGRGMATEIAKQSIDLGFSKLELSRVMALADPQNIATAKVLEKAGLTLSKRDEAFGLRIDYFAIARTDWQHANGCATLANE